MQLRAFLEATQPAVAKQLELAEDSPKRRKFLARLQGEITRRGSIDVLRKGVKHGPVAVLRALALRLEGLSLPDLAGAAGLDEIAARDALEALAHHDVAGQDGTRWRFTVELFRRWMEQRQER